ncbi:unnamed protein product [Brassica napus]|uniref:(rape) hypothetical protein n=1 Tax=Brassica napus TaxID=3708 RepID=A0A816JSX3_BRANA|nr:unnamed protein product [Brassica napus]
MMMIPVLVLYCIRIYIYTCACVYLCVRKAYLGEADIPQNNPINTYVRKGSLLHWEFHQVCLTSIYINYHHF